MITEALSFWLMLSIHPLGQEVSISLSLLPLYYFPDPLVGLRIFHSLLKETGIVLYLGPNLKLLKFWVRVYNQAQLEELFTQSRFRIEKIMEVGRGKIAYFAKARKQ